jgi:cellulose 1,4-beta-cellobiosidase
MKYSYATLLALAAQAMAAPSPTHTESPRAVAACDAAVKLDAKTNVWAKYTLHPNSFYRSEVEAAVAAISDSSLKAKAAKVADIGTFVWVDTREAINRLKTAITDVPCDHILGVVIYDLPGRDCAAKASNGELAAGQISVYKSEYIDRKFWPFSPPKAKC